MIIEIDFNSDEALYVQLSNQIIMGIAMDTIREGDSLPSVRQLADNIGINMHTVNKAYSVLRQQGFITVDRRRGAIIALDMNRAREIKQLKKELSLLVAKARCNNISREELHALVDDIYEEYSMGMAKREEQGANGTNF